MRGYSHRSTQCLWQLAASLVVICGSFHIATCDLEPATVVITPYMDAEEISSKISLYNSSDINLTVILKVEAMPYNVTSLQAMLPASKRKFIHYVGVAESQSNSPAVINCGSESLELNLIEDFSFNNIRFEGCWLKILQIFMEAEESPPMFSSVMFYESGLSISKVSGFAGGLTLSDVHFTHCSEPIPTGFRAAFELSDMTLNSSASVNTSAPNTTTFTVTSCAFSDITSGVAMLVSARSEFDSMAYHIFNLTIEHSNFTGNGFDINQVPGRNAAVLEVDAGGLYPGMNVVMSKVNISENGIYAKENGQLSSAAVLFQNQNSESQLDVQLSHMTIVGNTITPVRIEGTSSFVLEDSQFENNIAKPDEFDNNTICSGGLAFGYYTNATDSFTAIRRCYFIDNSIRSGSLFNMSTGGGAIQFFAHDALNLQLIIDSCKFSRNKVLTAGKDFTIEDSSLYHGGAVSIWYTGLMLNSSVNIIDNFFYKNQAVVGGAVAITITDDSQGSRVTVGCSEFPDPDGLQPCQFTGNIATAANGNQHPQTGEDTAGRGGGLSIQFHGNATGNEVIVQGGLLFERNGASAGGGIHAGFYDFESSSSVTISDCVFFNNSGIIGAGATLWGGESYLTWDQPNGGSRRIVTDNLNFTQNIAYYAGAFAVTFLEFEMTGNFTFENNINTALYLRSARRNLKGSELYLDNIAHFGAAICSLSSTTRLFESCNSTFIGNIALSIGGAIYAYDEVRSLLSTGSRHSTRCFMVYDSFNTPQRDWPVTLDFSGNIAGLSGPAVYVDNLTPCAWTNVNLNDPNRLLQWLEDSSQGNGIVPYLYEGLAGRTVYVASPGGSLQVLAYPASNAWNPSLITDLSMEERAELMNQFDLTQPNVSVGTDVVFLAFFDIEVSEELQLGNLSRKEICRTVKNFISDHPDYRFRVDIVPGLSTSFSAVACDQANNMVDAQLYMTASKGDACEGVTEGSPLSRIQKERIYNKTMPGIHIVHARPLLRAQAMAAVDLLFTSRKVDRKDVRTNVTVSVIGASNIVSTEISIGLKGCTAGFAFPENITATELDLVTNVCLYQCVCMRDMNMKPATPIDHRVLGCNGTSLYIPSGSWGHSTVSNESGLTGEMRLEIHECPPGFCKCNGRGDRNCPYNPDNEDDQCKDGRTGTLCAQCPDGQISTVSFYHGRCIPKVKCSSYQKWLLPATVGGFVPLTVSAVLFFQIPLSNELRGPIFFFSTLPMVFYDNDFFLLLLSGSASGDTLDPSQSPQCQEKEYYEILGWILSALSFSKTADCFYGGESTIDSVWRGYILPGSILIWMIVCFIAHCGCMSRKRLTGINLAYGAELLLVLVFQRLLVTTAFILRYVEVEGRFRYYYNAVQYYGRGEHLNAVMVAMAMIVVMVFFLVHLFILSTGKCFAWCCWYRCFEGLIDEAMEAMQFGFNEVHQKPLAGRNLLKRAWFQLKYALSPTRSWVTWDLFRRILLVTMYTVDYGEDVWAKHRLIQATIVLLAVVQALSKPYGDVRSGIRTRHGGKFQEITNRAISSSPKVHLTLPQCHSGNTCNKIETALLVDLFVISLLSTGSSESAANFFGRGRLVIVNVLVWLPIAWLMVIICYKVARILMSFWLDAKKEMQGNEDQSSHPHQRYKFGFHGSSGSLLTSGEGQVCDTWWMRMMNALFLKSWITWDLSRRVIILVLYMLPYGADDWAKHRIIMAAIVLFAVIQAIVRPYSDLDDKRHGYEQIQNGSETSPVFRKSPKYTLTLPWCHSGVICNRIEMLLLVDLFIICLLSDTSSHTDSTFTSCPRLVLICVLISCPIIWFMIIAGYKVYMLIRGLSSGKLHSQPKPDGEDGSYPLTYSGNYNGHANSPRPANSTK